MKQKKIYKEPILRLLYLRTEDIITSSGFEGQEDPLFEHLD